MRFYLNFPLVAGYVLMATTACLGMLQLAAARGGFSGLSLFTAEQKRATITGAGLTIGAILVYVLFAPEILTPGPAGTEVAEMFAVCAIVALGITLTGADLRLRHARRWNIDHGEAISLASNLSAILYRPLSPPPTPFPPGSDSIPAVVMLPDPAGFVTMPPVLVEALRQAGIAVLVMDRHGMTKGNTPYSRQTLLGHISTALVQLGQHPGIDHKRIGLFGVGLGGDATLRAAAFDPKIAAAVAVSPVTVACDRLKIGPGLQWLHELSYRQIWNWRRHWSSIQRAAGDLSTTEPGGNTFLVPTALVLGGDDTLTTRRLRGVERLGMPDPRHFTLLENKATRQQLVQWLQDTLYRDFS